MASRRATVSSVFGTSIAEYRIGFGCYIRRRPPPYCWYVLERRVPSQRSYLALMYRYSHDRPQSVLHRSTPSRSYSQSSLSRTNLTLKTQNRPPSRSLLSLFFTYSLTHSLSLSFRHTLHSTPVFTDPVAHYTSPPGHHAPCTRLSRIKRASVSVRVRRNGSDATLAPLRAARQSEPIDSSVIVCNRVVIACVYRY